jgi:peptide/nickel transport system permease protein
VAAGRDYLLTAWWVSTLPGIAILILVLSINLFGEGLRDILDPRLKIE